jgi:hypothetical protein
MRGILFDESHCSGSKTTSSPRDISVSIICLGIFFSTHVLMVLSLMESNKIFNPIKGKTCLFLSDNREGVVHDG